MKLKCPECGQEKRRIGLAGHLMLKHGYNMKEANQVIERLQEKAK